MNKLVSVKPVRGRYKPEVGDLVVGRIVQVQARRWKVDVGARLDAVLMLSSINLPGGVQVSHFRSVIMVSFAKARDKRRKLESDELQMRTFFSEGDLLVSEVQAFFQDGSISLHTRSLRYGKLRNGLLIRSPSSLISRLKSHFIVLPCGVQLIVGLNGFIWVCIAPKEAKEEDDDEEAFTLYSNKNDDLPMEKHEAIARVGKCIEILAESGVRITEARVASLWEASLEGESVWSVKDLAKGGAGRAELVQRLPIICEA